MSGSSITFAGVTSKLTKTGNVRRPAFLKMLRSGLVSVRSTGQTSDDDCGDASNGNARGNAKDPGQLADDIAKRPGSWWGSLESGRLILDCGYRGFEVSLIGEDRIELTETITRVEAMKVEQDRRDALGAAQTARKAAKVARKAAPALVVALVVAPARASALAVADQVQLSMFPR